MLSCPSVLTIFALIFCADPAPEPKLHVLAVGVDSRDKQNLGYYADDAEAVAYLLRSADPAPYSPGGDKFILRGLDASRTEVLNKLRKLREVAKEDDMSVVFFSTHGSSTGDGSDLAISLAQDKTLSGKELLTELGSTAGKIVLIMDTCRAGAILKQIDAKQHASISLLLATEADEDSYGTVPEGKLRHGVFVNALREGLLGLADDMQVEGNGDNIVNLRELGAYATRRATFIYPQQHAVSHPKTGLPEWPLVKYNVTDKSEAVESQQHLFFTSRNPWRHPDVIGVGDYLVRTLAAKTKFPEPDKDDNATAWPQSSIDGKLPECLEGEDWWGRWKPECGGNWGEGKVKIRIDGSTMFLQFDDEADAYLFEVQFLGTEELGGQYINVRRSTDDNGRWVGRFVDYDRIDGIYVDSLGNRGRWDFRRKFQPTAKE